MPAARSKIALGLISLLTVLAYLPALQAGFIWDDDAYVEHNPTLESFGGIADIWFDAWSIPQYYPLVHSSFWLEYRIWGEWAPGYHATNLLLHLAGVWLFARLLQRLRVPGAVLAAGIFAVHPVMVESVAWVTERKNVLSMLFYLLAALQALRVFGLDGQDKAEGAARRRGMGLMYLFFLLALASKSVTFSLPFALLLLCFWKRGRLLRREWLDIAPMVVCGAAYGMFTSYLEATRVGASGAEWSETLSQKVLIAGRVPWFYLSKLVWPAELTFIYERWVVDPGQALQWLFPIATCLLLGACVFLAVKRGCRAPLVVVLLFGGTLFPALGFISVYPFRYSFVADHFQFHACLAMLAAAAALLHRCGKGLPRLALDVGAALLLLVLAGRSYVQAEKYDNRVTLYESILADNPEAWFAYNNLASIYVAEGAIDKSRQYYIRTKQLWPKLDPGRSVSPAAYADCQIASDRLVPLKTRFDEVVLSAKAAQRRPDPASLQPLQADARVAEQELRRSLRASPDYFKARATLGKLKLMQATMLEVTAPQEAVRAYQEAFRHLEQALESKPEDRALRILIFNQRMILARKLGAAGMQREAQALAGRAEQLRREDPLRDQRPQPWLHALPGVLLLLSSLLAGGLALARR